MRNFFFRNTFDHKPATLAYAVDQEVSEPDERVRLALTVADYTPQENSAHDFNVTINYSSDGRSQLIYIGSGTQTNRDREWRRVWSWAFDVPGKLPWDQALALLDPTKRPMIGSWFTLETDDTTSVGYQIMVPAGASPSELDAAIQTVAEWADDLEKATVGTDIN